MRLYMPIFVLAVLAFLFAGLLRIHGHADGPEALEPGQAGEPTSPASSRHRTRPAGARIPVKYYLTAMLFIVFDIEIIFLYPWAVTFDKLGAFGLIEMVTFVVTVLVAYAYVWRRGGLEWD